CSHYLSLWNRDKRLLSNSPGRRLSFPRTASGCGGRGGGSTGVPDRSQFVGDRGNREPGVHHQQVIERIECFRQGCRCVALAVDDIERANSPSVAALGVGTRQRERHRVLTADFDVTEHTGLHERQKQVAAGLVLPLAASLT